jgi:hypothetical protein
MGRSGIRRRKRKPPLAPAEDTGILADLEDQAEWSSYGQNIPRLGNTKRNWIWWYRGRRFFRNLARLGSNPQIHDRGFLPAMSIGAIGVALFLILFVVMLLIVGRLLG